MPEPGSPGGRNGPGRVEVIYFPKKTRAPRRGTYEGPLTDTRTVEFRPDFASDEDVPTEPRAAFPAPSSESGERPAEPARSSKKGRRDTPTEELPAVEDPRGGRGAHAKKPGRRTRSSDRVKAAGSRRSTPNEPARRTTGSRKRISVEIDTDPALRYHVQKLNELLSSKAPAESLRSLSRMQLAEMAMFGHQLFESGRLEEARVVFEGLVALGSPDAFPHTMLGTVYLALGKQDRAMALFEAALGLDANDLAARVYRSEIRINQGHTKQALAELVKVIAQGPADDPFVERAVRLKQIVEDRARRKR